MPSTVPFRVDDGSHRVELEIGRNYHLPFSDKNDFYSFEAILKLRIDKEYYRQLPGMSRLSTIYGDAFLVEQGDPSDTGDGQFEFTRTYANVPATRTEGASVSFVQQYYNGTDLEEHEFTQDGFIAYEYFTVRPSPILKPRYYQVFGSIRVTGHPEAYVLGDLVPAEDSEVGIYKGGIFYRKTPFVILTRP